ncbi:hypothetical protein MPSEU_000759000 [Mayamaea pseudoterrestris]|nr:hypothetical protein MPSEU_000759000 [Mayamaea pseudoterrestris]
MRRSMMHVLQQHPIAATSNLAVTAAYHRNLSNFSRMLDLGGSPTDHSTKLVRTVNASKNSKIQAVCFDFDVLTMSDDESMRSQVAALKQNDTNTNSTSTKAKSTILPDMHSVQQVAKLLNVNLDSLSDPSKSAGRGDKLSAKEERDLERMIGGSSSGKDARAAESQNKLTGPKNYNPFDSDIRSKYAAKLAQKGASPSTSAASDSSRGDASFHLAARAAAVAETSSSPASNHKWLAQTGTGALLQYLTKRSIFLALLPKPVDSDETAAALSFRDMQDFANQIKSTVVIDVLTQHKGAGDKENQRQQLSSSSSIAQQLLQSTLHDLNYAKEPSKVLMVSDRDDYLKAAKNLSCFTCRIHRAGTPRGNVSAHYTVSSVSKVQGVVDEMNGISFSALRR